ncbi:MAG: hypothetical protein J0I09_03820 [Sphingobacteriia bacterium]|nr:hypothetical protein [Sphingobacteriia bacterium]
MKKFLILIVLFPVLVKSQNTTDQREITPRQQKQLERKKKIDQIIKQEEEGALVYQKQGEFGFKLNTDGWSILYEHGKYKTITKSNLWWVELGERKDKKEEKLSKSSSVFPGLAIGNPFVYGKINNFYYLKLGIARQLLLGGKGNKNGVAVSFIYGGGLSLGMLKPYYLEVQDPTTGQITDVKYDGKNDTTFLNPNVINGASGFGKGFGEIKYVPGALVRTALRFEYGRYNEVVSALEVGINAEYYTQDMQILAYNNPTKLFFNAYVALVFGKRK